MELKYCELKFVIIKINIKSTKENGKGRYGSSSCDDNSNGSSLQRKDFEENPQL